MYLRFALFNARFKLEKGTQKCEEPYLTCFFIILIRDCWGNHKILTPIDLLKEIDQISARVFGKKIKKVCTYK